MQRFESPRSAPGSFTRWLAGDFGP